MRRSEPTQPAPVLMVQGTGSSVGKSTLVAGLCRVFRRRGLRVAPFKAQNMSNNAAVCADGGEIGRAQYAQAMAAGLEPTVDMNPILLKPQPGGCQVVVRGQAIGVRTAAEFFGPYRDDLWPVVAESLDRLRRSFELVIAEGAGSPAEINLRDRDLVNMRVALHTRAEVLLVADIDRGGAFAALLGTWEWLTPAERTLVRGFILNKFRGDADLLAPAPDLLEQRTGVPVIGVVPYLEDLALPDEDAAGLGERWTADARVEIAVVRFPHLSNFDEFGPLSREPGVQVRYVDRPEQVRAPDLVVLPGTKATIPDLAWLRERGLAARIAWLADHGTPVLGICGGYQMLGRWVSDPLGLESACAESVGLGYFDFGTVLARDKRLVRARGAVCDGLPGLWGALGGAAVEGYEIHNGRSDPLPSAAFLDLANGRDGGVTATGTIAGTYIHGLFEHPAPRERLVRALATRRGFEGSPTSSEPVDGYDRLADCLESCLRLDGCAL